MRVVNIDGSACTFSGAVARGFTRIVDGLFFGAVAAINMQKSKNQRWGDKVARTFVVAADTPGIRPERAWWRFVLAAAVCWLLLFLLMSTLFGLA
jgi:uncharacterized RDD family membrane protein YckC